MFGKKFRESESKADRVRRKQEEKAARKARRRAVYGRGSDTETTAVGISGIH